MPVYILEAELSGIGDGIAEEGYPGSFPLAGDFGPVFLSIGLDTEQQRHQGGQEDDSFHDCFDL